MLQVTGTTPLRQWEPQTEIENRSYNDADGITNIAGNNTEQDLKGNLTEFEINAKEYEVEYDLDTVSYTHLTLPTIYSV